MPAPAAAVSVIVTAHNCGRFLPRTLTSLADALAVFDRDWGHSAPPPEAIIVDDGSTDDTPRIAQDFTSSRPDWKVMRRPQKSSPSCARNAGVRAAKGNVLFFLDGDDLFLPNHVAACYRILRDGADFVKTRVKLADPVHADWKERIENSVVINLAVRRSLHEGVGGFPDYHVFVRSGEEMRHHLDVFNKNEDMAYNRLLARSGKGVVLRTETVEYCRHPDNAYDRQYEKFRRPFGQHPETSTEEEQYRLRLADVIIQRRLASLGGAAGAVSPEPSALELLERARAALRANDPRQGEKLCRQLLQVHEGHTEGCLLLGSALQAQNKAPEAVDVLLRAVRLAPSSPEAHYSLGRVLVSIGKREDAIEPLRLAVRLAPGHAEARVALGLALAEQGRVKEAVPHLEEAVKVRPTWAQARHNLGVALAQAGRPQEAVGQLEEALRLEPAYAEACYNLGNVLKEMNRKEEAVVAYRKGLELRPTYAEIYNNLGLTLTELGQLDEALIIVQQGVRLRPQAAEGHNNLGLAFAELGRFAEAEACYQEALKLDPNYADAHSNLGNALKEMERFGEAQASYQLALWLKPQSASAQYNRSLAWLQAGDWDRGWKGYEWRWKRKGACERHREKPRWDGSTLAGQTVLLWAEQGLGDAIQFSRYAARLKAKGGRVVLECPPPLKALLSTCTGVDEVVAEGEALPGFDVQVPLMSLPGLLGTTVDNVPAGVPYLKADEARVEKWRSRLEGVQGFKVGVVWQGNPRFQWDRFRSFPLAELAPLAAVPGVRLVSLQKGSGTEQVGKLKGTFEVLELDGLDDDGDGSAFLDTTAVMKCLDLVVIADTAAAHVAGALGVRVWLALSAVSDWRWLKGREETPWYPSVRLFRQEKAGAWEPVFGRMAREVEELLVGQGRCPAVQVEMSPGEILDRLTILEIKAERFRDEKKRAVVQAELAALERKWATTVAATDTVVRLRQELKSVNEVLWETEDSLGDCELGIDFGERFVGLARSVYRLNDQRMVLKQRVNETLGSCFGEQKQYGENE